MAANKRTILITGATDGIGQHTAKKLANDGNLLLVHGRKPKLGADLVKDLKRRGAKDVLYFNADFADLDQVKQMAEEISQKVDTIDVLINNAGVFDPVPVHSTQGYDMTWAVNVMAPFLLTRKLLPLIANSRDDSPRIITTSSISQASSLPPLGDLFQVSGKPKSAHQAYSWSKLGDLMITLQLAKILSQDNRLKNIKCLSMDPGTVNTKMLIAGWGRCGIEIRDADNTYELATEYGANQESGTYHFGWNSYGDAKSDEKLKVLWKCLEKHTGCTYTSILR